MAQETVNFRYVVTGNTLEIIPDKPLQDNSIYTIRVDKIRSMMHPDRIAMNVTVPVTTKMQPSYCTLNDVRFLSDMFGIAEDQILYYIREASKYADYMKNEDSVSDAEATFAMREFVKTKVTLDALMNAYIRRAAGSSTKGTLGVISYADSENYNNSIGGLIDKLKAALKGWGDALKGYEREGRAKPRYAKKAYKESTPTTFDQIVNDLSRVLPSNV